VRAHHQQAAQDLGVRDLGVADDRAARLYRLDHLGRGVAGQREARRRGVQLHRAPQRLLRAGGHGVRLVEHHDLVAPGRQRHLFLGKHFDLVAHDVDAAAGV